MNIVEDRQNSKLLKNHYKMFRILSAVSSFSICLATSFAVVPTIVALRLRTSDRRGINEFRRMMRCHAPLVWLLHTFSGPTRTVGPLWMVLEERSGALGQSLCAIFVRLWRIRRCQTVDFSFTVMSFWLVG